MAGRQQLLAPQKACSLLLSPPTDSSICDVKACPGKWGHHGDAQRDGHNGTPLEPPSLQVAHLPNLTQCPGSVTPCHGGYRPAQTPRLSEHTLIHFTDMKDVCTIYKESRNILYHTLLIVNPMWPITLREILLAFPCLIYAVNPFLQLMNEYSTYMKIG